MTICVDSLKNVIVIYSGFHYKRFVPYPREIAPNYEVVYHPKVGNDFDNYEKISNIYNGRIFFNIKEISYEMVKEKIDFVLSKK